MFAVTVNQIEYSSVEARKERERKRKKEKERERERKRKKEKEKEKGNIILLKQVTHIYNYHS